MFPLVFPVSFSEYVSVSFSASTYEILSEIIGHPAAKGELYRPRPYVVQSGLLSD